MNIFILDKDPYLSASYICDAHVVKMIVETCQLLSTADQIIYNKEKEFRYKITHKYHPCCKCLSNKNNYIWLCKHLYALLNEYSKRYNKIHKCNELFEKYWKDYIDFNFDLNKITFPKCMPAIYQINNNHNYINDVISSYRNYYQFKKTSMFKFKYKLNNIPYWLIENKFYVKKS